MRISKQTFKDWTLPLAIAAGVMSYFLYTAIPVLAPYKSLTLDTISIVQPTLLFAMLFVALCKVEPSQLRPHRWHLWLLLIQGGLFCLFALILIALNALPQGGSGEGALLQGAMICLICPTATAAAIVTQKIGGTIEGVVTYTVFINILAALLIPAVVPLVYPQQGLGFIHSFWVIMGRVFPMLICPFFAALLVRYVFPAFHRRVVATHDLAFYLWAISLALGIAVSTKSAMHAHASFRLFVGLALVSLATCIFQFWAGRVIGRRYGQPIAGSQALGQKATVFGIWAAYTFLNPVSSLAPGFYSIFHNLWNTIQINRHSRSETPQ